MRGKIKAAWAALVAKRTIAGWLLFLGSGLLLLSDKWDSLNSLLNKIVALNEMGFLASIVSAARSPALQLALFLAGCLWIGIAVIIGLNKPVPHAQPALTHAISGNVPAQIWDETLELWKQATALITRWVASMRNENQDPPSEDTVAWVTRFESFARNNFSLEQIKIVFEPFQFMVPNDLPSRMKVKPESEEAWKKLKVYEAHLQSFMRDDLRRPPPEPPPAPRPYRSFKQRLEDQVITIPAGWVTEAFKIEAVPPIPDTVNITQHTWHEGTKVTFTGDIAVSVKNLFPSQGIDLVNFRLLSITPPLKAKKIWKPSTQDSILKRVEFGDIPKKTTLNPGITTEVRLFKVTRPPSAQRLEDILLWFYGDWPEGHGVEFTPGAKHRVVIEVTGNGVSRAEATLEMKFSLNQAEPALTWLKLDSSPIKPL